jgi:hypothetical protein
MITIIEKYTCDFCGNESFVQMQRVDGRYASLCTMIPAVEVWRFIDNKLVCPMHTIEVKPAVMETPR